ncbi:AraC family transcriptional regulator [Paenibacillus sp. HB172176]|uniref:helix-turn-helix domain-containing protein n=1 Tax=Paenibacillus sp. HB172176 TaxID=2493690 RepID=UPI001439D197|nr:AraC family transcriptional regulator [Paenibacillus sp. HB172176]
MIEWQISQLIPLSFEKFQPTSEEAWTSSSFQLIWSQQQSFACSIGDFIQAVAIGQLLLVKPLQLVKLTSGNPNTLHIVAFHFPSLLSLPALPLSLKGSLNPLCKQLLMHIQAYRSTSDEAEARIHLSSLVFSLLMECFAQREFNPPPSKQRPVSQAKSIKRKKSSLPIVYAVRYMRKHLANPDLSLQEIAGAVGYHPNYFCQEFSHIFGISPIRHLNELRVSKALDYLENTDYPVKQICELIGIRNPGNFTGMVKSKLGMTPVEYRRRHRTRTMNV